MTAAYVSLASLSCDKLIIVALSTHTNLVLLHVYVKQIDSEQIAYLKKALRLYSSSRVVLS